MMKTTALRHWRLRFSTLSPPSSDARSGFWAASFLGPRWLTASAPMAIRLGGLPGWRGKRFISPHAAINVLASGEERLAMQVTVLPSLLDGQPALVCTYAVESPWPWRFVRDEFRALSPTVWLGMTIVGVPGLRRVGWPFQLERRRSIDNG